VDEWTGIQAQRHMVLANPISENQACTHCIPGGIKITYRRTSYYSNRAWLNILPNQFGVA